MAESKPSFTLPPIKDNSIGWGPASHVLPEQFRDIPYAPYSKGDKLGRIADWSAPEGQKQDNRETSGRTGRQGFNRFNKGNDCIKMFCIQHESELFGKGIQRTSITTWWLKPPLLATKLTISVT
jgi:hypothetical protein